MSRQDASFAPLPPILIADDDVNDLYLVQRRLTKAGVRHPVMIVRDGEEVVEFLTKADNAGGRADAPRPCLVFLDIKMPRLDGFEVLRWIRRQRAWKDLPVVILSGSDEPRDVQRAKELGATRYVTKLPPPDTFAQLIAELAPGG